MASYTYLFTVPATEKDAMLLHLIVRERYRDKDFEITICPKDRTASRLTSQTCSGSGSPRIAADDVDCVLLWVDEAQLLRQRRRLGVVGVPAGLDACVEAVEDERRGDGTGEALAAVFGRGVDLDFELVVGHRERRASGDAGVAVPHAVADAMLEEGVGRAPVRNEVLRDGDVCRYVVGADATDCVAVGSAAACARRRSRSQASGAGDVKPVRVRSVILSPRRSRMRSAQCLVGGTTVPRSIMVSARGAEGECGSPATNQKSQLEAATRGRSRSSTQARPKSGSADGFDEPVEAVLEALEHRAEVFVLVRRQFVHWGKCESVVRSS